VKEHLPTFGVPQLMRAAQANALEDELVGLWQDAHGSAPAVLANDLDLHRDRYFNPVAQGARLREALASLPERTTGPIVAPPQLALEVMPGRWLITPEGRVVIEMLRETVPDNGVITLPDATYRDAERLLLDAYRRWARHRLTETIDLLNGRGRPLQLMPIGGVLTLLVNRSDDPQRAVRRFPPGSREAQAIDQAFFKPAERFAAVLQPDRRAKGGKERLISGWTLSEVGVRLPGVIQLLDDPGVYIDGERRDELLRLIARELAGREASRSAVTSAYEALVDEFRVHAAPLAGHGLLFERPAATEQLRRELTSLLP
jgi:hypothetical protein